MIRFLYVVFLSLIGVMAACVRHEASPQEDELYRIEYFYQRKLDSAIKILDTLNISVLSEKERAHYCMLRGRTYQLYGKRDAVTDSLLHEAEQYFTGSNDRYLEAMTFWTISLEAALTGKDHAVLDYRLKALHTIAKCKHVDERFLLYAPKPTTERAIIDRLKYEIHMRLGLSYAGNGYYDEGIYHLGKAERYFFDHNISTHIQAAYSLGYTLQKTSQYDSCFYYYQRGYQSAEASEDTANMSFFHYFIASNHIDCYKKHHYSNDEEKYDCLRKAISENRKGLALLNDSRNKYAPNMYEGLAYSYYQLQQYDSVIYCAEKVIELSPLVESLKTNACFYLFKSYEAIGDREKALHYAEQYLESKPDDNAELRALTEVKEEYDHKMEMQKLKHEQQMKRIRLYLLVAVLVIALVLSWHFISRYRKNKELEMLKLREAQRQLQAELEKISQHQKEMLQQRVMSIYQSKGDRLQHILDEFEAAYPKVSERLATAYPDLTKTENRIFILSLLQFRAKEMADLLGLSENTVNQYRYNLRKKTENASFSSFLD